MTTAETTRDVAPPEDDRATRSRVPPSSPGLAAAWLLRVAAFTAVAAGITGVLVAPGVRGNASESVFLVGLLVALVLWGATELVRARGVSIVPRVALIGAGAAVVAMSSPGLGDRLPWKIALCVAGAATLAVIAGAYASARAPHTRAVAGILFTLAFAAIARLAAWALAEIASEEASVHLYGISRDVATAGVMFEALAQLVAVTWLWTRSKLAGQVGSTLALAGAVVLTWGASRGVHSDATPWQAVLHTALSDAPGLPTPYFDGLATFLVPASLLLALVSAGQPKQVTVVVATIALALVSRGALDAPLRALCAVAAAQWAALAGTDERAMWRTLIDDRKRRLEDDDISESSRPPGA